MLFFTKSMRLYSVYCIKISVWCTVFAIGRKRERNVSMSAEYQKGDLMYSCKTMIIIKIKYTLNEN